MPCHGQGAMPRPGPVFHRSEGVKARVPGKYAKPPRPILAPIEGRGIPLFEHAGREFAGLLDGGSPGGPAIPVRRRRGCPAVPCRRSAPARAERGIPSGWWSFLCPERWKRTLRAADRVRNSAFRVNSSPMSSIRSRSWGLRPAAERRMAAISSAARSQSMKRAMLAGRTPAGGEHTPANVRPVGRGGHCAPTPERRRWRRACAERSR